MKKQKGIKQLAIYLLPGIILLITSGSDVMNQNDSKGKYVKATEIDVGVRIETDMFVAEVVPKGDYRTGVKHGFLDKKTGIRNPGALNITDYPTLLPPTNTWEPWPEEGQDPNIAGTRKLVKTIEGPQLCVSGRMEKEYTIEYEIFEEKSYVLVHQWFTFTKNNTEEPGCLWDEWLLFPSGKRYFFAFNKLTSKHEYYKLALLGDWPGHISGDDYENVYLSYHGIIPREKFAKGFPKDVKYFYQREYDGIPERMIRAYQVTQNGKPGPWLGGLTLDPSMMLQAECHARKDKEDKGYVCLRGMLGGVSVKPGESFTTVNIVGFFDSIDEMNQVYDKYRYKTETFTITDFLRFITD
ncbi:hypothetical protein ACFLSA_06205 [Bacteroidota bacterium]